MLVAAAGNNDSNPIAEPARLDAVVGVSCVDRELNLCDFELGGSQWGPNVELAAPGKKIYTTCSVHDDCYETKSGTSLSAPIVSGTAALVWEQMAENTSDTVTNVDVREIMNISAEDLGSPGQDSIFGHGQVNTRCALTGHSCDPPRIDGSCGEDGSYECDEGDYRFTDLRDTAGVSSVSFGSDGYKKLDLSFPFSFYGVPYTSVYVHEHGFVSFSPPDGADRCGSVQKIPDSDDPNNLIAGYWSCLTPGSGDVTHNTIQVGDLDIELPCTEDPRQECPGTTTSSSTTSSGTSSTDDRTAFVVQWSNVPIGGVGKASFQILLFEETNNILVNMHGAWQDGWTDSFGYTSVIGTEDQLGSDGIRVKHGVFSLASESLAWRPKSTL